MAKHMEKTIQKSVKAANGKIKNIDETTETLNDDDWEELDSQ